MAKASVEEILYHERVKTQRSIRGWTQAELARRTGIDQTNISSVEKGGSRIGQKRARVFAAAFDEPENWLLYMTGGMD